MTECAMIDASTVMTASNSHDNGLVLAPLDAFPKATPTTAKPRTSSSPPPVKEELDKLCKELHKKGLSDTLSKLPDLSLMTIVPQTKLPTEHPHMILIGTHPPSKTRRVWLALGPKPNRPNSPDAAPPIRILVGEPSASCLKRLRYPNMDDFLLVEPFRSFWKSVPRKRPGTSEQVWLDNRKGMFKGLACWYFLMRAVGMGEGFRVPRQVGGYLEGALEVLRGMGGRDGAGGMEMEATDRGEEEDDGGGGDDGGSVGNTPMELSEQERQREEDERGICGEGVSREIEEVERATAEEKMREELKRKKAREVVRREKQGRINVLMKQLRRLQEGYDEEMAPDSPVPSSLDSAAKQDNKRKRPPDSQLKEGRAPTTKMRNRLSRSTSDDKSRYGIESSSSVSSPGRNQREGPDGLDEPTPATPTGNDPGKVDETSPPPEANITTVSSNTVSTPQEEGKASDSHNHHIHHPSNSVLPPPNPSASTPVSTSTDESFVTRLRVVFDEHTELQSRTMALQRQAEDLEKQYQEIMRQRADAERALEENKRVMGQIAGRLAGVVAGDNV